MYASSTMFTQLWSCNPVCVRVNSLHNNHMNNKQELRFHTFIKEFNIYYDDEWLLYCEHFKSFHDILNEYSNHKTICNVHVFIWNKPFLKHTKEYIYKKHRLNSATQSYFCYNDYSNLYVENRSYKQCKQYKILKKNYIKKIHVLYSITNIYVCYFT